MQKPLGYLRRFNRLLVCCVLLAVLLTAVRVRAASKVEVLGAFSSITHAHGDAFGYTVQLWKEGDRIYGQFLVYVGPPADPPTGNLEDVTFDPRSRHLSFTTRVSTGLVYSQEYRGVPSRERFKFEGTWTRRQLVGNLIHTDELFPDRRPTSKRIRLRWSAFATEIMTPLPPGYSHQFVAQDQAEARFVVDNVDCNSEEHVKAILDFASIERQKDETTTIFIITRLGNAERSRRLNQQRLFAPTRYFIERRGISEKKVVAAEGARVKGPGQVEIYVSGKLYAVFKMKRHRDFAPGSICKITYD